jgi:hypothetical protein
LELGQGERTYQKDVRRISNSYDHTTLGQVKYQETIAQLFNTKYGMSFDKSKINTGYFICTKI